MKITLIAGARPNFMKIAPIIRALEKFGIQYRLVHTGQHYDQKLSENFFTDLGIPKPDCNLEIGGGSHAEQTAGIMLAFEKEILSYPCDYVLVVGDVNSTLACSLVAKKLETSVIHVEAGLRSRDLSMPEEINRMVVDAISDVLFTTTLDAKEILLSEGKDVSKIHFVGNVMIDTLLASKDKFSKPDIAFDFSSGQYFVLTLHRPANVDQLESLKEKLVTVSEAATDSTIIFPVHPRTKKNLDKVDLPKNILTSDPLGYLEFMYLISNAIGVITDSGGIQEETTFLGVPCLTLRENTERPETIYLGTNELIGNSREKLFEGIRKIKTKEWKKGQIPELWDGKAAERIAQILLNENS